MNTRFTEYSPRLRLRDKKRLPVHFLFPATAPRKVWRSGSPCFNPHPSRRTGATHGPHGGDGLVSVSILTRPEGRALLTTAVTGIVFDWFQSSPVPKDGRYCLREPQCPIAKVSILTRPEGRALPRFSDVIGRAMTFQSSPVPKDGRYRWRSRDTDSRRCFNPHPSRRTGATMPGAVITW